jgi:hypothetical protein
MRSENRRRCRSSKLVNAAFYRCERARGRTVIYVRARDEKRKYIEIDVSARAAIGAKNVYSTQHTIIEKIISHKKALFLVHISVNINDLGLSTRFVFEYPKRTVIIEDIYWLCFQRSTWNKLQTMILM